MKERIMSAPSCTHSGYKTIGGIKLRLFRFERIPLVSVGDLMNDPTGVVSGNQVIAYVGPEGVGYENDFNPANENHFILESEVITFYRLIPDDSFYASDRSVNNKLIRMARAAGLNMMPGETPDDSPRYQHTPHYVSPGDDLTTAIEKLDTELGSFKLNPNPAGIYTDILSITVNEKGQVTHVTTIGDDPTHIIVRRQFLRVTQLNVGQRAVGRTYVSVDLGTNVPANAKAAICYLWYYRREDEEYCNFLAGPNTSDTGNFLVAAHGHGENEDGNDDYGGVGVQFVVKLADNGAGGKRFYIRDAGSSRRMSPTFYLLGYLA